MVSSVLPPLLLLLLASSCLGTAHADAVGHIGDDEHKYMVVAATSLNHIAQGAVCSGHKMMPSGNRTWVALNRPHGPCSSSSRPSERTPGSIVDDMLLWDQLRTSYIRRELSTAAGEDAPVIDAPEVEVDMSDRDFSPQSDAGFGKQDNPMSTQASELAPAAIGNSLVTQTVVIDTSSDIPWVQCLPCPAPQCHLQKDTFYDPTKSSTYAPISCSSPACAQLGGSYGNGCSASQQCQYVVNYGDGRATSGTYITDTLTLTPTTAIKNFRFGCSHAVRGSFSDQTAGVLALGGGSQSLLAQTAGTFGNAFSYCVPQPSSVGFLSLGGPTVASSRFARTPLIKNIRAPTFYVVRLQAITVAGQRLNVPPAVFSAGSVMDSSAVVTQLPPTAYRALRTAFRSAMRMYPLTAPIRNLDTCYDFIRFPKVTVPKVSLVFDRGAVLQLDATSVMIDGCLAFTATPSDSSVGFIGNVQQQTYEVLYDVGGSSVGFRRGAC